MEYIFFDKKTVGGIFVISNTKLAEELRKPNIRKFEKRKVHSSFIDSIWGTDTADMQLIS